MAYLLDDEERKAQQQGQQPQGAEQVMTGPSSGVITPGESGTGQAQQSQAASAPKAGGNIGGFTNLQSYVTANQGNDAAMGQKVTGVVGADAQKSDAATQNFQGAGSSAVTAGTTTQDKGLFDTVKNNAAGVASDPSKSAAWQQQLAGHYSGPDGASKVAGYEDAQKASDTIKTDLTQASGDNVGRQGLLDKAYGRANYTSGEKGLDSFLLGAGADGQKSLADIQSNYGKNATQFGDATTAMDKSIGDAQNTSKATAEAARGVLGQAGQASEDGIKAAQQKLAASSAAGQQQFQGILDGLNSRDPAVRAKAEADAQLDPEAAELFRSSNGDMSTLLHAGTAQGLGDVLTPEQIAQYKALGTLGYQGGNYGDFAKSGSDGKAFTLDADRVKGINDYNKLYTGVLGRTQAANDARTQELQGILGGVNSMSHADQDAALAKLGISREDYEATGGDVTPYIHGNGALKYGDIASDAERTQFSELQNYLNAHPAANFDEHGGTGGAYEFDKAGFTGAAAAAKAAEAEKNKRAAALAAPPPPPPPPPPGADYSTPWAPTPYRDPIAPYINSKDPTRNFVDEKLGRLPQISKYIRPG